MDRLPQSHSVFAGQSAWGRRDKDLLKVGGEKVSARDFEDVIGGVPGVASVAVVGKQHDFLNEVVVAKSPRRWG